MATEGEGGLAATEFSWSEPHPLFAIILVGEDDNEIPFGIQKDFLCAKSSFYRKYFAENLSEDVERVVKLPNATPEVFGLTQHFLYTGRLYTDDRSMPSYEQLIAVWKLGHDLGIDGICDAVLIAMTECRQRTQHIPSTPLLIKAWQESPEGSSIRKLLLTWTAEYIRSSESRSEFSKSLPQEVLSELVVAMSHLNSTPLIQVDSVPSQSGRSQQKNVHYLEAEDSDDGFQQKVIKHRHSDVALNRSSQTDRKPTPKKSVQKISITAKPAKPKRSSSNVLPTNGEYPVHQKLQFCSDMLAKMLAGPGFWTRLVGPFREPVRPVEDGVPDYLDKVQTPMDLGTIKEKMDNDNYNDEAEFVADVRQIFKNCYAYHSPDSSILQTCQKFEKTFEEKWTEMNKWVSKVYSREEAA